MDVKFTPTLANVRRELITRGEFVKFSQMFSRASSSDDDRIAMTLKYMTDFNLLPFKKGDALASRKSAPLSKSLWNAGNRHFMKNSKEAILFYTKSIAAAPYPSTKGDDSEQLAFAFANRSAVYFVMGKLEACLKDIEHALMFNYPEKLRSKLVERKWTCYQKMEIQKECLQENINHKPQTPFLPDHDRVIITNTLTPFQQDDAKSPSYSASLCLRPLPQKSFGQHENIGCASDCLDMEYNLTMGRHIVANRDIDPGAILFVEEPHASVLLPEFSHTHCYRCLKRSDAMIPCPQCDSAMYCSSFCRDKSWGTSHNIECWLLPAFCQLDVGQTSVFLLPLRIFLAACSNNGGLTGLYKLVRSLEEQNPDQNSKGFDENGKYLSLGYTQIHYLCHHRTKEPDFQLTWAVGVGCILNLLEVHSDFFKYASFSPNTEEPMYEPQISELPESKAQRVTSISEDSKFDAPTSIVQSQSMHDEQFSEAPIYQANMCTPISKDSKCEAPLSNATMSEEQVSKAPMSDLKLFAGGLLLKYIGITTTNCFSVTEFVVNTSSKEVDEVPFGDALYATLSLLNHSCNPNALNSFHRGDVHVVMAKQPIRKGEEIFISYGGSFSHREITERQHELNMNYHFTCQCEACINLWPTFANLRPINSPIFVCQQCATPLPDRKLNGRTSLVTCPKCRKIHNLFQIKTDTRNLQRRIIEIYNEIKSGSEVNFKEDLAEIVKVVDRTVQSPCQLAVASQQYLRYSLKATGNHVIQ